MTKQLAETYLIHSDEEMQRLERQAAIYGTAEDLAHLALQADNTVLDAGCGAGAITRTIAGAVPGGHVTGLDREARYIDYARRRAQADGLANTEFVEGNVLALPFADNHFDIVWSKHLLQWVRDRDDAIAEFVRVTRPGGRVIAANFDGFLLQHYPEDPQLQRQVEQWFSAASEHMGFDNWMGRKLPALFLAAGLVDVQVNTVPDRAFSGLGGDPERRWNMQVQMDASIGFSEKVFGSREAARAYSDRLLARASDPGVYFHCTMFYVEGRVPQ